MLVKVNPKYAGAFGLHNKELHSVSIKTSKSEPFEISEEEFKCISDGVLILVEGEKGTDNSSDPTPKAKKSSKGKAKAKAEDEAPDLSNVNALVKEV